VDDLLVVDNGSSDATAAVASVAGATVLREDRRGYGSACLRGIAELVARPRDLQPDVVVFLDADHSDFPEELPALLAPIASGDADLVIGSRMRGLRMGLVEPGALLPQARFGNRLACTIMQRLWGAPFTDLGPFRAITLEALLALEMQDRTYGWTVEMQLKALQAGLRCVEVPVSYRRRIGQSKITGTVKGTVGASVKILWTLARYATRAPRLRTLTGLAESGTWKRFRA
jgi:glycosyltransferase involved in cell wall biosynthesis